MRVHFVCELLRSFPSYGAGLFVGRLAMRAHSFAPLLIWLLAFEIQTVAVFVVVAFVACAQLKPSTMASHSDACVSH